MLLPLHVSMPTFLNFSRILNLLELQQQVRRCLPESHGAMVFEFHPNSCMGHTHEPMGTYDFTTHVGAPEHVHVV